MGKQGPCCHCGVTSTPLWRNGPPDKPVLCNACGSRWRTKGTLVNYTPLHLRAEPDEFEDSKTSRMRKMFMKKNESMKVHKLKLYRGDDADVGAFGSDDANHGLFKSSDEGGSNRSSSGSAISNSDSCALFGGTDASDLTGPSQGMVWDTNMVPSKKRSRISRPKSSPVEKLTKDLHKILKEQQASSMSGISEDDVLLETNQPTVFVEIGHGSVLIRHPSSIIAREEESEASSLSFDNKLHPVNEAYSRLKTLPVNNSNIMVANIPSSGIEKIKKMPSQCSIQQDQTKRELLEKLRMLGHHNSPLRYVDLKDVVNFDVLLNCLSSDEQLQMLKYLPSVDTCRSLESMKSMFESPHFKETLSSFQKLLGEGVFDNSLSGVTTDDCRKLQRLLLCSLVKSKWVQQYTTLKGPKSKASTPVSEVEAAACHSVNMRELRDGQCRTFQGTKGIPKCPKTSTVKINPTTRDEPMENDGLGFSPRNLFTAPSDNSAGVLSSLQSADGGGGGSDQDLLLDIPSYSSFPQAELLYPTVHHRPLRP